mmetsp:Transcript_67369/g.170954  ORF Transcript_67369/g.170954 Transcript_67369/m.170954 type:complete len:262 (-) Transcript_67369:909-1694(-)
MSTAPNGPYSKRAAGSTNARYASQPTQAKTQNKKWCRGRRGKRAPPGTRKPRRTRGPELKRCHEFAREDLPAMEQVMPSTRSCPHSLMTDKIRFVVERPKRPHRPRHAVCTQPLLSWEAKLRSAPPAAVCTAAIAECLSMAFNTAWVLVTKVVRDCLVTINLANSFTTQQPASCTRASSLCCSMASKVAFTAPYASTIFCASALCTQVQKSAQQPARCTSAESAWFAMASSTTCTPPRDTTASWKSALQAVRFRSTPHPRT